VAGMGVAIRKKHNKLYLDIYYKGRRRWESLGLSLTGDKQQDREALRLANIARVKREQQLFSQEWGILDPVGSKKHLLDYCQEIAQSMPPRRHLHKAIPYIKEYGGNIRLDAVDEQWLEGFKAFLLSKQVLKQITAAHYFSAVCHVLRIACKNRLISHNPAEHIKKISEPEPIKVWLTPEELERLAVTPLGGKLGSAIKRSFLFACMVGLRISDLQTLRWGDIQRTPEPTILKRQKKTEKVVGVPINHSAWSIIDDGRLHHQDEYIFPELQTKTSATQYFRAWAKAAGIEKKIGWHTARHTFAVLALENGADLYTVSKLLGHTDIQTTQIYAKATDKMKRSAVELLPEIQLDNKVASLKYRKYIDGNSD
jgi:integrase